MVDIRAVLDGLTALTDRLNAGEGGLAGLQRAVDLAREITGASGAAFVEYGAAESRVIAVAGDMGWTLGRPVDTADPAVRRVLDSPGVHEFAVDTMGTPAAAQLSGTGVRRVMRVEACVGGIPVGVLSAGFTDADGTVGTSARAAFSLVASTIAGLYSRGGGLPSVEDAPVVGGAQDAFAVLSPDHTVRHWNPAATVLTTRSAADAIGQPWPFPLPEADERVEHQMACGRWIEIRRSPMPTGDGIAVSFRPRPDNAGGDDRDLFIAVTGHELRTPVTVIRGYAETLMEHWDSLDDTSRREGIHVVGMRARELARLVDRMLHAVAISDGPSDARRSARSGVPFDLVDTLREAAAELSPDLRKAMRTDLPSTLPKALGDRAALATVLTELVTNAGKYSPERVELDLSAGADAQTVWFRIADRGVGIHPEHVERAFERFWQLETGSQRRYGGVGLGLYLVRRLVEKQHGWVSLRPRQGGGTVAEVRLPRADAAPGRL